jgi:hypothetical protein
MLIKTQYIYLINAKKKLNVMFEYSLMLYKKYICLEANIIKLNIFLRIFFKFIDEFFMI